MKGALFTSALLLGIWAIGHAQWSDPEPYFSAIIVEDIDRSIEWYSNVMGYELKDSLNSPARGFIQANLSNSYAALELIEIDAAIKPEEVIENYNAKTKVIGFFKLGFQVDNLDQWMESFEINKVFIYGDIVRDPISGRRMIIIQDPDGNRIQFFEK